MSVKEETNKLKEEVVVEETNSTETELAVQEGEVKPSKAKAIVKTALKVAGVGAVGVLGFILGARCSRKNEDNDNSEEIVEAEIIDE